MSADLLQLLDSAEEAESPAEGEAREAREAETEGEAPAEPEAETEAEDEEGEAPEAEGEAPEAPEAPADPLSDEALSTPEGIKAGAEHVRQQLAEMRKERDARFLHLRDAQKRLQKREARLKPREEAWTKIMNGEATSAETLATLGETLGLDPIEALKRLNFGATGKPQPDAVTRRLEAQVQELKAKLEGREQERTAEEDQAFFAKRTNDLITLASTMPNAKLLIDHSPAEAGERLRRFKLEAHEAGAPISDEQAAQQLEQYCIELRKRLAGPGNPAGSGKAEATGKQTSITSTKVSSQGSKRKLTEDEYLEQNAESILQDIGLM